MKTYQLNLIVVISVIGFICSFGLAAAATNFFSTVITQNGSVVSSANTTFHIIGDQKQFLTTSASGSSVIVNFNQFPFITEESIISYDPINPKVFLNDEMNFQSDNIGNVTNGQLLPGTLVTVNITPLKNALNGTVVFTLFDNGVNTGKTITIGKDVKTNGQYLINQQFNKGDNLYWQITQIESGYNPIIVFNTQVLFYYKP